MIRPLVVAAFTALIVGGLSAGCGPRPVCTSESCADGCCDASGVCFRAADDACGLRGAACVACAAAQTCRAGACVTQSSQGGGTGVGGGGGGGANSMVGGGAGSAAGGGSSSIAGGSAVGGGNSEILGGGTGATVGGGTAVAVGGGTAVVVGGGTATAQGGGAGSLTGGGAASAGGGLQTLDAGPKDAGFSTVDAGACPIRAASIRVALPYNDDPLAVLVGIDPSEACNFAGPGGPVPGYRSAWVTQPYFDNNSTGMLTGLSTSQVLTFLPEQRLLGATDLATLAATTGIPAAAFEQRLLYQTGSVVASPVLPSGITGTWWPVGISRHGISFSGTSTVMMPWFNGNLRSGSQLVEAEVNFDAGLPQLPMTVSFIIQVNSAPFITAKAITTP